MRQPGKVRLRDQLKPDERKQEVAEKIARPTDMRLAEATYKGCLAMSRNCLTGDDRLWGGIEKPSSASHV